MIPILYPVKKETPNEILETKQNMLFRWTDSLLFINLVY